MFSVLFAPKVTSGLVLEIPFKLLIHLLYYLECSFTGDFELHGTFFIDRANFSSKLF